MKYRSILAGLAAVAALAVPSIAKAQLQPPLYVHGYHTTVTVALNNNQGNGTLWGGVSTAQGGRAGRLLYVYDRNGAYVGSTKTGLARGHSGAYYAIKVPNMSAPFTVYATDWFNSSQAWDLEAATGIIYGSNPKPPISFPPAQHVSINSVRGEDWFTGKVGYGNGEAGRTVVLYSSRGKVGITTTGTTRGHSAGYWQIQVNAWAGISLNQFDAYVTNLLKGRVNESPAQSVAVPFNPDLFQAP